MTIESEPAVQSKPTILCVDDEQNILAALKRLFRPAGYKLLLADGAAAALKAMEQSPADLVISDMRMPLIDGARLLTEVKRRWPETIRILLTGFSDIDSTIAAINQGGVYRYVSKPWDDNDLRMTVQRALDHKAAENERRRLEEITRRQNAELKALNDSLEQKVKARTEEIRQTVSFLEVAYEQLKKSYRDAIPVFAHLIEMREGIATGHGRRVAELAQAIGGEMGLEGEAIENLCMAALLHDIGKIGLPDELIRTPQNNLSTEQREEMQKHAATGQAALMSLPPLEEVGRYIRSHHERYDGNGYPDGLAANAIAPGARIIAVANEYDNLLTGTLLGEQFGRDEARAFLVENRGRRYDPAVVDALLRVLQRGQGESGLVSELKLATENLAQGMVLTRDLLGRNGMLLLKRGHTLTAGFIGKLRQLERDQGHGFVVCVRAENHKDV